MVRLAAIGLGLRMSAIVQGLTRDFGDVKLVAAADPDESWALACLKRHEVSADGIQFYASADEMLKKPDRYDGILIGTRCYLHTPMALKVAATGLPLYLEKPVAITWDQVAQLREAFRGREKEVVVSFPLRVSPLFQSALEIIRSGRLGTINQVQAVNNVAMGGVYYGEWYRNYDETGGMWLQKATHDFDCITQLVGSMPTTVAAVSTRKVYGGDKPEGLKCSQCKETATCIESPENLKRRGDNSNMMGITRTDHWCAFGRDIRHQDAGSAIIRYANGTIASYDQNFVTRRTAGRRGATITGHNATLEFDWYSEKLRVIEHHNSRVDEVHVRPVGNHGGGDRVLQKSFIDLIRGGKPCLTGDLNDALLSVAMCLAAKESCATGTFQVVRGFGDTAQTHLQGEVEL